MCTIWNFCDQMCVCLSTDADIKRPWCQTRMMTTRDGQFMTLFHWHLMPNEPINNKISDISWVFPIITNNSQKYLTIGIPIFKNYQPLTLSIFFYYNCQIILPDFTILRITWYLFVATWKFYILNHTAFIMHDTEPVLSCQLVSTQSFLQSVATLLI